MLFRSVMVEAGAQEVPEKVLLEALRLGHKVNQELAELQDEVIRAVGRPKTSFEAPTVPAGLESDVAGLAEAGRERVLGAGRAKGGRNTARDWPLEIGVATGRGMARGGGSDTAILG